MTDIVLTRKERRRLEAQAMLPTPEPEASIDIDAEIERLREAVSSDTISMVDLQAEIETLKNVPIEKELQLVSILQERRDIDAAKEDARRAEEELLASQKLAEAEHLARSNARILKVRRFLKIGIIISTTVSGGSALAFAVLGWG